MPSNGSSSKMRNPLHPCDNLAVYASEIVMQCPKCSYVRKPTDTAPDYECPQCGIVYAKFNAVLSDEEKRKNALRARTIKHAPQFSDGDLPEQWREQGADEAAHHRGFVETLISAGLLVVGSFAPLVSLPIIGAINATRLEYSDGYILIGLAVLSIVLALVGRPKGLRYTGGAAFLITVGNLVMLFIRVSDAKAKMAKDLEGNPFAGIAMAAAKSISLEWGWILLIAGSIGLIATGIGCRLNVGITKR